jgi:hypothetical protein
MRDGDDSGAVDTVGVGRPLSEGGAVRDGGVLGARRGLGGAGPADAQLGCRARDLPLDALELRAIDAGVVDGADATSVIRPLRMCGR